MSDSRPRSGSRADTRNPSRNTADADPRGHVNVRHGKLRRSHPLAVIGKLVAFAAVVAVASSVSIVAIAGWSLTSQVKTVALEGEKAAGPIPQIGAIEGGVNLLLVGSDSRAGQGEAFGETEGQLNDVTMLLHIAQDKSSATVISFPRDMFVPIPSCPDPEGGSFSSMSSQKINTTLSYGGLPCTVLTVEALTGLEIPFAAEVQFNGVIEMSNAVGGVPVCVGERIEDEYTGLFLDPGTYNMEGMQALQFLRTRHGVGDGSDLGRISSQQVFLSSLIRTVKSQDTLTDMGKLYGLATAALSNMTLSNSLNNLDTIASIALALKDIDLDKVVFVQYPSALGTSNGQSGVLPIEDDADVLNAALAADVPIQLSAESLGSGSLLDPTAPVAAPAAPAADPANAPVQTDETTAPAPSTSPSTAVLGDEVKGQSAADYTCSNGRTLDDQ